MRAAMIGLLHLALSPAVASEPDVVPPVMPNSIAVAIERALPAVVKLYGATIGTAYGYGTGVLVSADGLVLTIDSVLLDASNLRAVLHDGRRFRAEVVRRDPVRELALLRIAGQRLPHLTLSPSVSLLPGDGVLIAGNAFKVAEGEETVSVFHGVLAARTRLELRRRTQPLDYAGEALVIDAIASNPGMAGGPLLDTRGRLVGVIGPIVEAGSTNTRLNFALPSEEIEPFLLGQASTRPAEPAEVASGGRGGKPYLGIRLFRFGYQKVAAYVDRVAPDSPAAVAGVRRDDLVVAIDDRRVASIDEFERIVSRLRPGQTIRVTVKRGDEVLELPLVVGEPPP